MKKVVAAMVLSGALGFLPALAQEKNDSREGRHADEKEMGMKEEGIMMEQLKGMQREHGAKCAKHGGGMMKGRDMMKSEDMQGMGKSMGEMSGDDGEYGADDGERQDDAGRVAEHVEDDERHVRHGEADVGADGTGNEEDSMNNSRRRRPPKHRKHMGILAEF